MFLEDIYHPWSNGNNRWLGYLNIKHWTFWNLVRYPASDFIDSWYLFFSFSFGNYGRNNNPILWNSLVFQEFAIFVGGKNIGKLSPKRKVPITSLKGKCDVTSVKIAMYLNTRKGFQPTLTNIWKILFIWGSDNRKPNGWLIWRHYRVKQRHAFKLANRIPQVGLLDDSNQLFRDCSSWHGLSHNLSGKCRWRHKDKCRGIFELVFIERFKGRFQHMYANILCDLMAGSRYLSIHDDVTTPGLWLKEGKLPRTCHRDFYAGESMHRTCYFIRCYGWTPILINN